MFDAYAAAATVAGVLVLPQAFCSRLFLRLGSGIRGPLVAFFIPDTTINTAPRDGKFAIQTNNVEIDDRDFIYLVDRANTGLHIVDLTGYGKQIVKPYAPLLLGICQSREGTETISVASSFSRKQWDLSAVLVVRL